MRTDASAMDPTPGAAGPGWTDRLPEEPGVYDFFDPFHRVRCLLQVRRLGGGLAVRVPGADGWSLPMEAWRRPCLRFSRWRGPLAVPAVLPADVGREGGSAALSVVLTVAWLALGLFLTVLAGAP
jgi:hypothetical protein